MNSCGYVESLKLVLVSTSILKPSDVMQPKLLGESHIYSKECGKGLLVRYLHVEGGFLHNALAHVEKSHLVLVQSDAWSCRL